MADAPFRILNPDGSEPAPHDMPAPRMPYNPNVRSANDYARAAAKARAAGDTEAYQYLHQLAAEKFRYEGGGDPVEGMSGPEKFAAGWSRGVRNIGRHLHNLVPDELGGLPDEELAERTRIDAPLMQHGSAQAGSALSEAATMAPAGGVFTGTLARAGAPLATQLAKPIVRGAVEGAGQGFVMGDPGRKMQSAVIGGGVGGAVPATAAGLSTAARGITRTPEAEALLARGVDLTPGQMNPRGWFNQIEEATQSAPFVGAAVKGARDNAQKSFAQAGAREAAAPGAQIPDGDPRQMLDAAYQSFQPLYDQAKGFPILTQRGSPVIVKTGANEPLSDRFLALVKGKQGTTKVRNDVGRFLQNELGRGFKSSDDLLEMRSAIRMRIRDYKGEPTVDAKDAAALLERAEAAVTEAIESQLPKQAMDVLKAADKQYGVYKVFEDAMYRAKDQADGFTPLQLSMAARDSVPSAGAYARGAGGVPREMATQGVETMQQRVPATGARLLPAALALPTAGASYALPALVSGTKTGRRLAAGQTGPQKLAAAMMDGTVGQLSFEQRQALADAIARATAAGARQNIQVRE